jgi:hypothetical protein
MKSMMNMLKYLLTALSMTLSYLDAKIVSTQSSNLNFDSFRYLWIVTSILATWYRIYWDLRLDWGLLNIHSMNYLLRDELSFPPIMVRFLLLKKYYMVMVLNIIMRCSWIILFYLHFYFSQKLHFTFWIDILAGVTEIFRRSIWNILHMEYLIIQLKLTEKKE